MKELFVKKYWDESDTTFYIHFLNEKAVAQIEVTSTSKIFLSTDSPVEGDSMLYDQSLDELELEESDFIAKDDFMELWNDV